MENKMQKCKMKVTVVINFSLTTCNYRYEKKTSFYPPF